MTRIYLVRHAEAEGNLYRIAQGQDNSNLTDRGWQQVRALERRFAGIPVDAVYASDLYRTCATASAVCRPKKLPLHRRTDLREICVGCWEQRTWGDIAREDPEQMYNFANAIARWKVEGAESPAAVTERLMRAVREIAAENQGKTVAVFSHGMAIRLTLAALQGYSLEQLQETPLGSNTAVSLLEERNGALEVVFRDDISHLLDGSGNPPVRRASGLEVGLWFAPAAPEDATFLKEIGLPDATLVARREELRVGALKLGAETGRIDGVFVLPEYRGRGFGAQMLGQAVMQARAQGGEKLRITAKTGHESETFLREYGFHPVQAINETTTWEKFIGFDPEILAL